MLTLTSPIETWAHRLPAAAKMAALTLWTAVLFHYDTPLPLTIAAAATLALPLSCGPAFAMTSAKMLRPLWPFVLIVALWHLWQHDLSTGAVILLRLLTAVTAANFVTMTTRLSDMIRVLTTLARPLGPDRPATAHLRPRRGPRDPLYPRHAAAHRTDPRQLSRPLHPPPRLAHSDPRPARRPRRCRKRGRGLAGAGRRRLDAAEIWRSHGKEPRPRRPVCRPDRGARASCPP